MMTNTRNINFIDRVNLLMKYSVDKTIDENDISKVQKSYFGPKKTFEKMMNEQGGVPGAGVSDWQAKANQEDLAKHEQEKKRQEQLKTDFNSKFTTFKIPQNKYKVQNLTLPKDSSVTMWKKNEDRVKRFFKSWEGSQWDSYIPKNKDFDYLLPDDSLRAFTLPDGKFFTGRVKRVSDNPLKYEFDWYYDNNDKPYDQNEILGDIEIPDDFLVKEEGFWDKWGGWITAGLSMLVAAVVPGTQGLLLSALIDLIQVAYSLSEGDKFGAVISTIFMFIPFIGPSIKGLGRISKAKATELAEKFAVAESKAQVDLIYEGLSEPDKIIFRTVFSQDPNKIIKLLDQKYWDMLVDGLRNTTFDKADFVKSVNELIRSGRIQYPELAKWWQKNPGMTKFGIDLGASGLVLLGAKIYADSEKKKGEEQKIKQVQKTMFGGQGIPKTKEQIDSLMNDPLWDQ
jgi:hypothetical protein